MATEDRTLTCRDCGATFIFAAAQQQTYISAGFVGYEPPRCPECVEKYKAARRERLTPATPPPAPPPPAPEPVPMSKSRRKREERALSIEGGEARH